MIVNLLGGLAGQLIGLFGAKGAAKQRAIATRIDNMKRTWVDEILVLYWFAPSVVAWFNADQSAAMIAAMTSDEQFLAVQVGITAAVFGLNKLAGRS